MKKVLFGITSLTLGGAERVLVDLSNALCEVFDITIFTIYANGELEKQLSNKVKLKSLYNIRYNDLSKLQKHFTVPLKILFSKNKIYNKIIKQDYDTEIAFLEGPISRLFSVKNSNTDKIAWIHNDISLVFGNGIKSKLKRKIDKKIYSQYDKLVFVSKDNLEKFEETYNGQEIKNISKKVIYNYIDKNAIIEKSKTTTIIKFDKNEINFVTVARLTNQKGIDRLINVHRKLIENGFKHKFYVIGDGPEKEKLEKMIKENGIENSFYLLGKKENPYPYIKQASYFCLLSKYEGYGMVLEEAKILNKSIVITNTAAREAVLNYKNSLILENTENAIYEGLKQIIQKDNKETDDNKTEYDNTKIIGQVVELIEK